MSLEAETQNWPVILANYSDSAVINGTKYKLDNFDFRLYNEEMKNMVRILFEPEKYQIFCPSAEECVVKNGFDEMSVKGHAIKCSYSK